MSSPADRVDGAEVLLTLPVTRLAGAPARPGPSITPPQFRVVVIHSSTHETPLPLSATMNKLPPAPVSVSFVPSARTASPLGTVDDAVSFKVMVGAVVSLRSRATGSLVHAQSTAEIAATAIAALTTATVPQG